LIPLLSKTHHICAVCVFCVFDGIVAETCFFLIKKNCFQYIWKVNPEKTLALSKSWVSKNNWSFQVVKVDESVVCVFDTTFVENTSHMHVCVFDGIVAETCFLLIKKIAFNIFGK
jgi:hypothetical protein